MLKNKILSAVGGEEKLYADDCFSTFLYQGNGSTQTINNGIDLAGKGGMVWIKDRSLGFQGIITDGLDLSGNPSIIYGMLPATNGVKDNYSALSSFNNDGFSITSRPDVNREGDSYVSWTFRKAPKFFDEVTYTGNGAANRTIPHGLGVAPGFVTTKSTSTTGDWNSYHRSATGDSQLNLTNAQSASRAIITAADTSSFTVSGVANTNGVTYVAYLFAHDPSADGIIQCGSYTGNGSATVPSITLGWEPQYLMIKNASGTGNWQIIDSMRGMPVGSADATLQANLSNAESSVDYVSPTATGFQVTSTSSEVNTSGFTYVYMAIRRPNKPPTTGTQVYTPSIASGVINTGFPVDLHIGATRSGATNNHVFHDRLRGGTKELVSSSTASETTITDLLFDSNTGLRSSFAAGLSNHFFKRAPKFMDIVYYTGDGATGRSIRHGLGVAPEFIIAKRRVTNHTLSGFEKGWRVWFDAGLNNYAILNTNEASGPSVGGLVANYPTDPANYFNVSGANPDDVNGLNSTYVAHLFASLPGVSKVGSYTGNGTSQTINCGFTTGCRFFLVKSTSTTGNWWVFDSARGIVSSFDPALALNSTAAEITSADAVDPDASGIIVNQEATCSINASGVSYIFLAIA